MRKVIIWFVVVIILAIYAKISGMVPVNSSQVLGSNTATNQPMFQTPP